MDASAATRGSRDWRQDGGRQPAKHHSSLATQASAFGTEGVLERSCSRAVAVGTRRHRPLALAIGKRRQRSSLLCFIASVCRFRAAFFWRSGQHIGFAASQCVPSTHNLKAQPSFEDCCAKNKSGYLRIRATAVKERIEAVTNGQGRQGREDL